MGAARSRAARGLGRPVGRPETLRIAGQPLRRSLALVAAGLLVLAPGLAPGALAQEDETRVITDAVGDGGALPDCEPAGGANSAVDIIQVEVSDVAGTRTVLIRTDGDLGAAIAAEPDVRVEVWVTGDGGVTLIRFRHGVQAGEPLDDVIDEEGLPVGEVPASIEAGPAGEVIFEFPIERLEALALSGDQAHFGTVVVGGAHCDKLGMRRVGGLISLLEPFRPLEAAVTTTAVTTTAVTTTAVTSAVSTPEPADESPGGSGVSPALLVLIAVAVLGLLALLRSRSQGASIFHRVSRARCDELQDECARLRRLAEDADKAAQSAAAEAEAADDRFRDARRRFIDQRDASRDIADAAADSAADAAAEGTDESNWVEGDAGRITQGDLELMERASREAQERYEDGGTAEALEAEWSRTREERLAEAKRQRDARAKEAADQAAKQTAAARAAQREAEAAMDAAETAAAAAHQAKRDAAAARDRARAAADKACRAATECFDRLGDDSSSHPAPATPADVDFGA
mgnify:CR=1 FL=1